MIMEEGVGVAAGPTTEEPALSSQARTEERRKQTRIPRFLVCFEGFSPPLFFFARWFGLIHEMEAIGRRNSLRYLLRKVTTQQMQRLTRKLRNTLVPRL
jgi:hypothetical protein